MQYLVMIPVQVMAVGSNGVPPVTTVSVKVEATDAEDAALKLGTTLEMLVEEREEYL